MVATEYPRIAQLGMTVIEDPVQHVTWADLDEKVIDGGLDREQFSDYFGVQTCHVSGPYPWDVEAVLERMMGGKLTGTQKYWD